MENIQNQEISSLILPYQLTVDSNGIYIFKTDKKIEYSCKFKNISRSLSPVLGIYDMQIFDFEFWNNSTASESKDERISVTISNLISDFFKEDALRVLVYLCDSSDNRHKERSILFRFWLRTFLNDFIQSSPISIEIDEGGGEYSNIHGSALIRKDFPHMEVLQQELLLNPQDIIREKYGII